MAGLLGSTTAFAQTAAPTPQQQEQTMTKKDKKDRKDRKDRKDKKDFKDNRQKADMFAGIELTQNQQAELQKLRESIKADRQKAAEVAKAKRQKAKEKAKADMKDMREKRINAKKEYLAKIKNILTPEQYVKYLENFYTNSFNQGGRHHKQSPKMAQGHHGMKGKMNKPGDSKKGERPQGKRQGGERKAPAQAATK